LNFVSFRPAPFDFERFQFFKRNIQSPFSFPFTT
jgi:hypothetical protein